MPKDKRRRTMVFLGTTGHHNNGTISVRWLADHKDEVFAKTALIINCEHTATTQTYFMRGNIRKANTTNEANFWYTGGSAKLVDITIKAYRAFGVPTYADGVRLMQTRHEIARAWSDALSTLRRPTSCVVCAICRCRLSSETRSSSTMPMLPTPTAARYISTGEPSPPAPTTSTRAAFSFC
jgi:hypothetical protein